VEPIKILLVDDSTTARYALRLQLQRHGVQVNTAESAEAALDRVRTTPPDAILMDHTMPRMNGFEALEILKSSPDTAHIPVVMCTAHDDPAFSAQAVRRGALGVLTKTAATEGLLSVLDQIRATLAQGSLPEARPTLPGAYEATHEPALPVPAGPSREEIEALIEDRLGLVLPARLAEAVDPLVARINTQLRQVIAEQVETAVDALPAPAPIQVPLPDSPPAPPPSAAPALASVDLDRLRDGIIQAAVRSELEAELDRVLRRMQQRVHERGDPTEDPGAMQRLLNRVESTVTAQAVEIARREVADGLKASEAQVLVDALHALRRGLRWSYALGAMALILALGAVALRFLSG
jgi:CheY-like chemotaxis protein